ncbi:MULTISPECIES: spore germination protein GerW family protein [Leucobacter]|uniref:spore germination protein GerW family protein n=1 Tax=Leucobacter TaxID=55968 RepID=UPI0006A77BC6|nr:MULTISPECIES: spore germination protein GerW family protein [Leucobacter]
MTHLTKQIADTLVQVGVHSAYGDPVEVDGTTLIPVAYTAYGFGAGEGAGAGEGVAQGEGSGGGGGGFAVPLGSYVTREGTTRFEPNIIALLAVGVPFVWVAGRALSRIIRALKK